MSTCLLLMSYLVIILVCVLLIFGITISLSSFAGGQITINEFLPHPGSGNKERVELYIPDGASVFGYLIDDDTDFNDDSGSIAKNK